MKKSISVVLLLAIFVVFLEQCKHGASEIVPSHPVITDTTNKAKDTTHLPPPPPPTTGDSTCFNTQILPLVLNTCGMAGCHNASSAKKGYVLTNYSNISAAVAVINSVTTRGSMPKSIPHWTAAQIALFQKWWAEGAKDVECSTIICDTSNVTYTSQIQPLIQNYCIGCHSTAVANTSGGGIILDNYAALKTSALTGHLLCSIQWAGTCSHMPKGTGQFGICEQRKFAIWVNNNCPQ